LELHSDGKNKSLNGCFIGYGAASDDIVNGEVSVQKLLKLIEE
jgi:hypothetical protein